jgi:hypothetical protein
MIDRWIKVFILVGVIGVNTLLLGISYKVDICIDKLSKIELINDISLYKR